MSTILKAISNLITAAYGILCMPLVLLALIFMPFTTLSDGFKIIKTGYTVSGDYFSVMIAVLTLIYFSLRFRNLRRIYNMFPSLFELIKFLTITNLFIAVGTEILNWSHITLNLGRHKFGIAVFIICLVLWRVVVSVCYYKKPLVNFIPKAEEMTPNYSKEA